MSNNSLLSIFIGTKANHIANSYFYFESEQIYNEEDPIDHNALFKDISHHIPRSIHFGFNEDLDALQYMNYASIEDEKKDLKQQYHSKEIKQLDSLNWNAKQQQNLMEQQNQPQQLQVQQQIESVLKQQDKPQQAQQKIHSPYFKQIKSCLPSKKQIYSITRDYEEDFDTFTSGESYYFGKTLQQESYENFISTQMEEIDSISGFQIFVDTDCGFGSFGQKILQILEDECGKKQIITFALKDKLKNSSSTNSYAQTLQNLNEMFTFTQIRDKTHILVPLEMSYLSSFQFFNQQQLISSEFNVVNGLVPFISNATLPYRVKVTQGIYDIFGRILPYKSNNIFTIASDLPIIQQDGSLLDPELNIVFYKQRMQRFPSFWKFLIDSKSSKSYGESFMLRGAIDLPKKMPFDNWFDFKCLNTIYKVPSQYPQFFSENILKSYGSAIQQINSKQPTESILSLNAFPLHTCLFSNEQFKYNILNARNLYETGDTKKVNQRFFKDGIQELDLKELESKIMELYEAYNYADEL